MESKTDASLAFGGFIFLPFARCEERVSPNRRNGSRKPNEMKKKREQNYRASVGSPNVPRIYLYIYKCMNIIVAGEKNQDYSWRKEQQSSATSSPSSLSLFLPLVILFLSTTPFVCPANENPKAIRVLISYTRIFLSLSFHFFFFIPLLFLSHGRAAWASPAITLVPRAWTINQTDRAPPPRDRVNREEQRRGERRRIRKMLRAWSTHTHRNTSDRVKSKWLNYKPTLRRGFEESFVQYSIGCGRETLENLPLLYFGTLPQTPSLFSPFFDLSSHLPITETLGH